MDSQVENPSVTKIQELIYELTAGDAMAKNIITVGPLTTMDEVKTLFIEKRITGMPVVENGILIGIISLSDFIKWLADGSIEKYVADRMTKNVISVSANEPLVNVAAALAKYGFGRLPVLDRATEKVVGIVTKADIIQTLLRTLETDYRDDELRHYQTNRLFDELIADEMELKFGYTIAGSSIERGGVVASAIKKTLKRLGIHPAIIRRISISAYEAEMNVIIYAGSGHMLMTVDPNKIVIAIDDSGPGIPDVEQAMHPGFSTAPEWVRELGFGAGMGLANIKSCSDSMELESEVGRGTKLLARFALDEGAKTTSIGEKDETQA